VRIDDDGGDAVIRFPSSHAALRRHAGPPIHVIAARRLSHAALPGMPPAVRRPSFDPLALRAGILHLGCGAFHRAHQALLTQRAIEAELSTARAASAAPASSWGIVSASLRTPDTARALKRQGGLYTVLERGAQRTQAEVVGTLRDVVFAPENPNALSACFATPDIRIVTMTVTAGGYCIDPATGRLDASHPDIRADLRAPVPRSALGLLVKGLAQRRASGIAPPAVLSCDNIAANGRTLHQACIDFAALQHDDGAAQWIAHNVQFPGTMVDRIVPATTETDCEEASAALGVLDAAPVSAEPFSQWVIERFDGPRPRWEAAGAEFVSDVAPWEASKLRLLNGGHLAIAYLGLLAGFDTVADAAADPDFADYALRFMLDEQRPTLPPSDHDIGAYARQLLARWRNPGIAHQLERVGRDGSAKLPTRLLASLRDNLRARRPAPCTLLAIAAWMRCAAGPEVSGRPLMLRDRLGVKLRRIGREAGNEPARLVDAFLAVPDIFGQDLPRRPSVRLALTRAMAALQRGGARGAIAACLSGAWR
jgi:fructuronate reductase